MEWYIFEKSPMALEDHRAVIFELESIGVRLNHADTDNKFT